MSNDAGQAWKQHLQLCFALCMCINSRVQLLQRLHVQTKRTLPPATAGGQGQETKWKRAVGDAAGGVRWQEAEILEIEGFNNAPNFFW